MSLMTEMCLAQLRSTARQEVSSKGDISSFIEKRMSADRRLERDIVRQYRSSRKTCVREAGEFFLTLSRRPFRDIRSTGLGSCGRPEYDRFGLS